MCETFSSTNMECEHFAKLCMGISATRCGPQKMLIFKVERDGRSLVAILQLPQVRKCLLNINIVPR